MTSRFTHPHPHRSVHRSVPESAQRKAKAQADKKLLADGRPNLPVCAHGCPPSCADPILPSEGAQKRTPAIPPSLKSICLQMETSKMRFPLHAMKTEAGDPKLSRTPNSPTCWLKAKRSVRTRSPSFYTSYLIPHQSKFKDSLISHQSRRFHCPCHGIQGQHTLA